MMTFKEFLVEKAMNRKTYAATEKSQGDKALVGFEFEMLVPSDTKLTAEDSIDTIELDEFYEDVGFFYRMFDLSNGEVHALRDRIELWFEGNGLKSSGDEDKDFETYIKQKYGNLEEFCSNQGFLPIYGWATRDKGDSSTVNGENPVDEVFTLVGKALGKDLGVDIHVHNDVKDSWGITSDGSIDGDGGGVEVISPPQPLSKALADCKRVFAWMSKNDIETNITTGLHINISLADMKNVDLVKLVLFTGETHALKEFGRLNNEYTRPQITRMINNLIGSGELPTGFEAMKNLAQRLLSNQKYSSINISKLKHGYLEFRIAGGRDYHKDFDKIRSTALRFVTALEIAADPQAEKNEYIKKLTKIFGMASEQEESDYSEKPIIDILDADGSEATITNLKTYLQDAKAGKLSGESTKKRILTWTYEYFLMDTLQAFRHLGIQPSSKQRAEVKVILKRLGATKDQLKSIMHSNDFAKIQKAFSL